MAFVVIPHAVRDVHEIISKASPLQTLQIEKGVRIKNNHLYLAASEDVLVSLNRDYFALDPATMADQTIDYFFTSLAHEFGERAVAVMLSVFGDDGFEGLAEIHKYGGKILIQSRLSAPLAPAALPAVAIDVIQPTLVASPVTLALCLTSFALFNDLSRPPGEYLKSQ